MSIAILLIFFNVVQLSIILIGTFPSMKKYVKRCFCYFSIRQKVSTKIFTKLLRII